MMMKNCMGETPLMSMFYIVLNRIQKKSVCLHDICMCAVCIYINIINIQSTHTYIMKTKTYLGCD